MGIVNPVVGRTNLLYCLTKSFIMLGVRAMPGLDFSGLDRVIGRWRKRHYLTAWLGIMDRAVNVNETHHEIRFCIFKRAFL